VRGGPGGAKRSKEQALDRPAGARLWFPEGKETPIKVRIISPAWPEGSLWASMVFQFPLLSLTTLAAATPPGIEVEITDENVESLPPEDDADLVAITAMTPLAPRAYEIADRYRARGVPVVLGGVHPTWRPEEAARHADAVVRGEGDWIWPRVIADFQRGALAPIYEDRARPRLEDLRVPRWDLLRDKPYFFTNTLQTSRGCPHDCDFCSVTASHGRKYRTKPLEQVAREIEACNGGKGFLFIVDDNVIGHRDHAWRLFRLLDSYTLKWLSHATVDLAWDLPLLRECARSGCHGLFVGFESLSQRCLDAMGKRTNAAARYFEAVDRFHDAGIGVEGAFIFGNDDDDIRVFTSFFRLCHEILN